MKAKGNPDSFGTYLNTLQEAQKSQQNGETVDGYERRILYVLNKLEEMPLAELVSFTGLPINEAPQKIDHLIQSGLLQKSGGAGGDGMVLRLTDMGKEIAKSV